ncbi:hypothetical protein QQZ08_011543 [Neonectria magnoliae]|uniref:Uncharacterized protein n=1 Tax=Neonectria magnoliae TaxID=2732573 RepID=A0ABR1H9Z0_9HYPO
MDPNTEASSRNFGLRPKPPDLRVIVRPYEPVEPPGITQQPSPSTQEETGNTTGSPRGSPSTVTQSPEAPTETSITSTGEGPVASRTPTPPGPQKKRRGSGRAANKTSPTRSPPIGLLGEGTEGSNLPRNNSFKRAHRELWRQGTRAARRSDGTVEEIDVIHWMMTRKGGSNAAWPQLQDGQKAIENMRKETMDITKIWRLEQERQEEERLREERRLANKYRYRPRGQVAKEKAERMAARAAAAAAESSAKRARGDEETAGVDEASQNGDVLETGEPAAKRLKVDAVKDHV